MRKLFANLKNYKLDCVLAPLCKLVEALLELIIPLLVADVINRGAGEGNVKAAAIDVCIMAALAFLGLGFSICGQFFSARAATGFSSDVRGRLYNKLLTSPLWETDKMGVSTMITRMTSDINQMQNGVNMALRLLLRSPFVVLGAFVCALLIDVKTSLVFVATIVVLAIVVVVIMRITMPKYVKAQNMLDDVALAARENLTGARVIRAFGAEDDEIESFDKKTTALEKFQNFAGGISSLLNPLTFTIVNLAVVALLYSGAIRVSLGNLSQGMVVALYDYMSQILVELVKFANLVVSISRALASAKRVGRALELPDEIERVDDGETSNSFVEFRDVSVKYSDNAIGVKNVSFKVEKGQTVGIIGGTGSGKSTIVNLLPRLYDATEGTVFFDGRDVKSYPIKELRKRIGLVLQRPTVFKGTIRSNVSLCGDVDDQTVYEAVEKAQAADFVKEKGGVDAPTEQSGRNLSGGQKQRISIARALAKKPELLILDDSSSALDYMTDLKLRRAIASLGGSLTTIIVSQRASAVASADLIITLGDGEVVGIGTAEYLRQNCEAYREIESSQNREANK